MVFQKGKKKDEFEYRWQNTFNKNINKERWAECDVQLWVLRRRISAPFDERE